MEDTTDTTQRVKAPPAERARSPKLTARRLVRMAVALMCSPDSVSTHRPDVYCRRRESKASGSRAPIPAPSSVCLPNLGHHPRISTRSPLISPDNADRGLRRQVGGHFGWNLHLSSNQSSEHDLMALSPGHDHVVDPPIKKHGRQRDPEPNRMSGLSAAKAEVR